MLTHAIVCSRHGTQSIFYFGFERALVQQRGAFVRAFLPKLVHPEHGLRRLLFPFRIRSVEEVDVPRHCFKPKDVLPEITRKTIAVPKARKPLVGKLAEPPLSP